MKAVQFKQSVDKDLKAASKGSVTELRKLLKQALSEVDVLGGMDALSDESLQEKLGEIYQGVNKAWDDLDALEDTAKFLDITLK